MKKVFHADAVAETYRVRDLLRDRGIEAEVLNEGVAELWGEAVTELSEQPCVVIPDDDRAEEAKEIIRAIEQPPADRSDWTCPSCGEKLSGSFTACWSCQSERPA